MRSLACLALALALALPAEAQDRLYNQAALEALMYAHRDSLDALPHVTYRYYVLEHETNNSIFARNDLYRAVGDGDARAGREKLGMVAFLNRIYLDDLAIGDTLVLPSHFDLDARAYAPFPREYAGARPLGKLFVIHMGVQAWAAYEDGRLVRWGLVNTGGPESRTPAGRFNFNWKEEARVSTLSPPGERWFMRYVFNFHDRRGIHIHQYHLPSGAPGSHGCVRMMLADARWIYHWADGWQTTAGSAADGYASRSGRVLRQGTTVLVLGAGEEPDGPPRRFVHTPEGPVLRVVDLPADPYSVPAGTEQQRAFDQQRRAQQSARPAARARA
ncbi:MAG: L,D-transpeptidase [Rubricoccaceae bacterium]